MPEIVEVLLPATILDKKSWEFCSFNGNLIITPQDMVEFTFPTRLHWVVLDSRKPKRSRYKFNIFLGGEGGGRKTLVVI